MSNRWLALAAFVLIGPFTSWLLWPAPSVFSGYLWGLGDGMMLGAAALGFMGGRDGD